jgi:hypothetical protein
MTQEVDPSIEEVRRTRGKSEAPPEPRNTDKTDEELLRDSWGSLNFILAFYVPGQTYLDTEAWKRCEANARRVHAELSRRLGIREGDPNQPFQVLQGQELEDVISDGIQDSIDMDWTSTIGAKAVVAAFADRGITVYEPVEGPK